MILNKYVIESFVGDILPLWIKDADASVKADFSLIGDAVRITEYKNGVLVSFLKAGDATVKITYKGETAFVPIKVRKREELGSEEPEYFFADFHNHTTNVHSYQPFVSRSKEKPADFLSYVNSEGKIDAVAITDHALCLNDDCFFEGFTAMDEADGNVCVFPGAESEVIVEEMDRFGIKRRISGEIVTFGASSFSVAKSYEEFEAKFENDPLSVAFFAHPLVFGNSTPRIWNFPFERINTPKMRQMVKGVECINDSIAPENMIYDSAFSRALDFGFKVSPVASSDSHGPVWGYSAMVPKTVILAKNKSREALFDAIVNNRFYATESGDLKVKLTVNGKNAPCEIERSDRYEFSLSLESFTQKKESLPVVCRLVSNGGVTVFEKCADSIDSLSFSINSENSTYFYFKMTDKHGKNTWSVPVFVNNTAVEATKVALEPVPSDLLRAYETDSGANLPEAVNGDPDTPCVIDLKNASITLKLLKEQELCAVGLLPLNITRENPEMSKRDKRAEAIAMLPSDIEIYGSCDGEKFFALGKYKARVFGEEELFYFEKQQLSYVRIDIKSNIGSSCGNPFATSDKTVVGNISVFKA